ncbi:exosortase H [Xanthomonadaceae bacterium XH05]|nr:exosortase H [Xanthomonadaceae bacterium XH05]
MIRFFVVFVVLLVTLFSLRITTFGNDYVTEPFTAILAQASGFIIKLWDRDVYTTGVEIWTADRSFGVGIAPGCDGIEAVIILISAIVAFPSPWKHKVVGIALGFIAIQSLNLVRIISLFYMGQWSQTMFDWFHLYLWQALIVLDALAVWLVWLRYLPRRGRPGRGNPPSTPDSGIPAAA